MTTPAKARARLLIAIAGLVVSLVALGFAVSYRANQNNRFADLAHHNCLAIEHLKSYAYHAALRAEKTLPTLAYYREHPNELQVALDQVRDQKKFFAPNSCP